MKRLNHKEEEVMSILWRLGHAFVNDILTEMEEPKPPYNTVSSIVRKLVDMGYVGFEAYGKNHRYYPVLPKEVYRENAFKRLMDNYFGGSPKAFLSFFIKEENISEEELGQLLKEVKKREEKD